jgi:hypothetical protein
LRAAATPSKPLAVPFQVRRKLSPPQAEQAMCSAVLAYAGIADPMHAPGVAAHPGEQRPGQRHAQRQCQDGIPHAQPRNFGLPGAEVAPFLRLAVLVQGLGLVMHLGGFGDDALGQHEDCAVLGPSGAGRGQNPQPRRFGLQVVGQPPPFPVVDVQPCVQQFAAHFLAGAAQEFHRHGPGVPVVEGVLEAQQPPEPMAVLAAGDGLDMHGRA